jgi:hypothetical protein
MAVTDVKVASIGVCYIAPEGTALPTDADTALNVAFVDYGEISVDGLTEAFSVETSTIENWEGETIRILQTKTELTFRVRFLETTEETMELFYGGSVESQTTASRIPLQTPDPTPMALAITLTDTGDDTFKRFIIPRAVVQDRSEVQHMSGDASSYEVTFAALKDATLGTFGYLQFDADLTA